MDGATSSSEWQESIDALHYWRQSIPRLTDEELVRFVSAENYRRRTTPRERGPFTSQEECGTHFRVKFSTDSLQLNDFTTMHPSQPSNSMCEPTGASKNIYKEIRDHSAIQTETPEKCRNGLVFGNIKDGTREKQSIFLSLEVLEESVVTSEEIVKKVGDPLVSKEQMLQRSVSVDPLVSGDVLSTGGGRAFHEGGLLSLERPPEQFECKVPKSYSFDSQATLGETVSPDSVLFVRDASASISSVAGGNTHPGLGSFVPHITLKKPKKLTTFSAIPYDRSKTNSQYRKVGPILTTEREVIDQSTSLPAGDGDGAQEEKSEGDVDISGNEILGEDLLSMFCLSYDEENPDVKGYLRDHAMVLCEYLVQKGIITMIGSVADGSPIQNFMPEKMYMWTPGTKSDQTVAPASPCRRSPVWPPPKPSEDNNHGLKYTEADHQQVLMGMKKEHTVQLQKLQSDHHLSVFSLRGEHAAQMMELEEQVQTLRKKIVELETKTGVGGHKLLVDKAVETDRIEVNRQALQPHIDKFESLPHITDTKLQTDMDFQNIGSLVNNGNSDVTFSDGCGPNGDGQSMTQPSSGAPPPPPPPPHLPGGGPPPPPPPPLPGGGPPPPPPPPPPGGFGGPPPPPLPGFGGPPPPLIGGVPHHKSSVNVPLKPMVEPAVPMKALYWSRIQIHKLESKRELDARFPLLWSTLKETDFNIEEFEDLFSKKGVTKKKKALSDTIKKTKAKKVAKLLDDKRSQAVGIFMSSLHIEMRDLEQAVLKMDLSVVDLESLQSLYDMRPQKEELAKIKNHLQKEGAADLDKPEQFLHEVSQIPEFANRVFCITYQSTNEEQMSEITCRINILQDIMEILHNGEGLKKIFSIVLAFGNYMNGGNRTRGQADGFGLEILAKLKDVKSADNSVSLLQFVIFTYIRQIEENLDAEKSHFPLPDTRKIDQACHLKFEDIDKAIKKLKRDIKGCELKVKQVVEESSEEYLEPFQGEMEKFLDKARENAVNVEKKLEDTRERFQEMVKYFHVKPKSSEKEVTLNAFFSLWMPFCEDFKDLWKKELRRAAKMRLQRDEKMIEQRLEGKRASIRKSSMKAGGLKSKLMMQRSMDLTKPVE
ncbi:uncharacterized protein [Apostichopus japonicus]|uniref:uncharacterized protein isoform X2 n=1 Tax=Stichopus japonicus TaxID=307972 RepID=UPI003AB7BDF2